MHAPLEAVLLEVAQTAAAREDLRLDDDVPVELNFALRQKGKTLHANEIKNKTRHKMYNEKNGKENINSCT